MYIPQSQLNVILDLIEKYHGVDKAMLLGGKTSARHVIHGRKVLAHVLTARYQLSREQIGSIMGKHHTTITHYMADKKVNISLVLTGLPQPAADSAASMSRYTVHLLNQIKTRLAEPGPDGRHFREAVEELLYGGTAGTTGEAGDEKGTKGTKQWLFTKDHPWP